MKIKNICFYLAISLLFLACANQKNGKKTASKESQPNMVFVLLDDLGYSDLGCYGGEIKTPHIDNLATGGVRFESIYNSARCCPSRASLMTGLYPPQAGIADFTTRKPRKNAGKAYLGHLRNDCVTMGEVLKGAGYNTYYVGKWHMHEVTGPTKRGFDEFYGYTMGYAMDQWDPKGYKRLPEGREMEINVPEGEYYATDVFNDYAIEFIKQGEKSGKPWFVFVGHSSPHFPVQAPKETVDKYYEMYLRGWDVLREERFERMKQIGLITDDSWTLTERSLVPVDKEKIANGFPGKQNPAWNTLEEKQQKDLARRMAVFAAMVEHVDNGIGQIVKHLKESGNLENTIIMLTSDNGACYEWGPLGFDGPSRRGITKIHEGAALDSVGGPGTWHSYGSAWANMCNTPFRLYKHYTHEGGVASPFVVHWPAGIRLSNTGTWVREKIHLVDIMPTVCEVAGANYPETFNDTIIQPMQGVSLANVINGTKIPSRSIYFSH
ncbi:MAG: arylsulfatase, partial [Bacteroidales bacterium]|nr:arylsulfatase [Bacteroidales bacterium]